VTDSPAVSNPETAAVLNPYVPPAISPVRSASGRYDRSIVEGPLPAAVWKLAWPSMITNIFGGLQGIVDHVMVGHLIGYEANAAIGVAMQIFIVAIVFISSLFAGMGVLIARFAGAGEEERVDRTVYQALLFTLGLSFLVLAPAGYLLSPWLFDLVHSTPSVRAEGLPFLRVTFLFSFGMLVFFMVSAALRSVGDARTPMILGAGMTALNIVFNVVLITGMGPFPALGTTGAAVGTVLAAGLTSMYAIFRLARGGWLISFPRGRGLRPDWPTIRAILRFGMPMGIQGVAMNIGGVLLLMFIGSLAQSAAAQAAYAISYTQLFSLVTWTSAALLGAAAAVVGQNLGARRPDRARSAVHVTARIAMACGASIGVFFLLVPRQLLAVFGMTDPVVVELGTQLLRVLSVSGILVSVALVYTGALQGTGDMRGPLYISLLSQLILPLGICLFIQRTSTLEPVHIWLAILAGHALRCSLSVIRFEQGKWREITVQIDPY
jgi:putative MATE family efflux protein